MTLFDFNKNQAQVALELSNAVLTDHGKLELHDIHKQTLHAIAKYVFQTDITLDDLGNTFDQADSVNDDERERSRLWKLFPASVSTSSNSILLMCSAWCFAISIFITALASPRPSSLSARNIAVSDRSKVCATVLGFVLTSANVGLLVSGSVPFSATPPPLVYDGLSVTTLQPLFSHHLIDSEIA